MVGVEAVPFLLDRKDPAVKSLGVCSLSWFFPRSNRSALYNDGFVMWMTTCPSDPILVGMTVCSEMDG